MIDLATKLRKKNDIRYIILMFYEVISYFFLNIIQKHGFEFCALAKNAYLCAILRKKPEFPLKSTDFLPFFC